MNYKYSGHETFAFRYAWLPKAYNAVKDDERIFSNEDQAMVRLGVGKNMVRSIRFWALVIGIIESETGCEYSVTDFGKSLLDPKSGLDPYLEDSQTLWLLHWRLTTAKEPLYSWHYLLNRWQDSEMVASVILPIMMRELSGVRKISQNSLNSLLQVFFHTYVPTRGNKSKVIEDNLDCPLVQLHLIEFAGDHGNSTGRKDPIYVFRRGEKPEISQSLFVYCLVDFWLKSFPDEKTLSFEQIAHSENSPGQIFKLSEDGMQERLNSLESYTDLLAFTDSSTSRFIERKFDEFSVIQAELLKGIY